MVLANERCLGIILGMGLANEKWYFIVTASLIGWAHTKNYPWCYPSFWGFDQSPVHSGIQNPEHVYNLYSFLDCFIDWITNTTDLFNTLRPRQHGRHFPDDIFRCISLNENILIAINISLSFVPKGPIDDIPALVQIMAWRRSGDKPLSEPMMNSLLTHICVTRPQWIKIGLNKWLVEMD